MALQITLVACPNSIVWKADFNNNDWPVVCNFANIYRRLPVKYCQSVKFYTLNVWFYQLQHRIHPVFESTLKENIWSNTKQYNYSYILVLILPQLYIDLLSCKPLFLWFLIIFFCFYASTLCLNGAKKCYHFQNFQNLKRVEKIS